MTSKYKTVEEIVEMLDERGITIGMEICREMSDPAIILYSFIEALIDEIDPTYLSEEI